MISALYSQRYAYLANLEFGNDGTMQFDHVVPRMREMLLRDILWKSAHPCDAEAFMDDRTYRGVRYTNLHLPAIMVWIDGASEGRFSKLMGMIERVLERRSPRDMPDPTARSQSCQSRKCPAVLHHGG